MECHVQFAERLADRFFGGSDYAFPARFDLFSAAKGPVFEVEVFINKILGQFLSSRVDEMPAQICLPIVQRCVLEHLVGGFEESWLVHVNIARLQQIDALEIIAPIPVGRQILKVPQRHPVVILLRIAQLDLCSRGFGELCL